MNSTYLENDEDNLIEDSLMVNEDIKYFETEPPKFTPENISSACLPLQDEDWEIGSTEPSNLNQNISEKTQESEVTPYLEPFTNDILKTYYHNLLLANDETYTDQFIKDSSLFHSRFELLLKNYYQAYNRLLNSKSDIEKQNDKINDLLKQIFVVKEGKVSAQAFCQDQKKVSATHLYEKFTFDEKCFIKLSTVLQETRNLSSDENLTNSYMCTLCRLHCEKFVYDETEKYKCHRNNLMMNAGSPSKLSIFLQLVDEALGDLKQVCNLLFSYLRLLLPIGNQVSNDVQRWLSLILVTMLQSGEDGEESGRHFREELFVLNHIIRCPPKFYLWLNGLVQISGPILLGFKDKTAIDHSIYLLYLMLIPVKGRADFLSNFKRTPSEKENLNSDWTLIGEIEEEFQNLLPEEEDLIILFEQVPFEKLLVNILGLTISEDGSYIHAHDNWSSEDIMKTLAITDALCNVLSNGLTIYGIPRYKQFVRRLAQTVRNIILLMSKHLEMYQIKNLEESKLRKELNRLQLEFDEFCKRCISKLLSFAQLGIYQFIADLPFKTMSLKAVETLYVLMIVPASSRSEVDKLVATSYSQQEWIEFVQDPDTKLAFQEQLCEMSADEMIYLLTAFANVAQARQSNEHHVINNIAINIYNVSFVYTPSKDVCCKTGRELLSSLSVCHPSVISTILNFIHQHFDLVRTNVIYSVSSLVFSLWKPSTVDIKILFDLIVSKELSSTESQFAQFVIKKLNFGQHSDDGDCFLTHSIHCELAVLIVEGNSHMQLFKRQGSLLVKSFDQVSRVASSVYPSATSEGFVKWCWDVLLQLKLHQSQYMNKSNQERFTESETFVKHELRLMTSINKAIDEGSNMAKYVSIMMTDIGHKLDLFLNKGIEFLFDLSKLHEIRAVTNCLFCTLPLVYNAKLNLGENERFKQTMKLILDSNKKKIWPEIAVQFNPKLHFQLQPCSLIISLFSCHLKEATNKEHASSIILYWLEMVVNFQDWYRDTNLKQIVDVLCQHSLLVGNLCTTKLRCLLYQQILNMRSNSSLKEINQSSSLVASFVHFVSGQNFSSMPTMLTNLNEHLFFVYAVLEAETRYENDSKLWENVLSVLSTNAHLGIDTCLKKTAESLKLQYSPRISDLTLFKWCELALNTPIQHPMLEVIWLQFFFRFIYIPNDGGGSQGFRFFSSTQMLPAYNKLRKKIESICEYHISAITGRLYAEGMKSYHQSCVQLFQSLKLWLEEPKLHESNLYLPSLPIQYNPELLALIRTKQEFVLEKFLNINMIAKNISKLIVWQPAKDDIPLPKEVCFNLQKNNSAEENLHSISQLLKHFKPPQKLPYLQTCNTVYSPVQLCEVTQLWKYETVLKVVSKDLEIISNFGSNFVKLLSNLEQADSDYLKHLPKLYYMKESGVWLSLKCQAGFASIHKCSGPAQVHLTFKEMALSSSTSHNLQSNRIYYKEALNNFISENKTKDLCDAALHLECVVAALKANLDNVLYTNKTLSSIRNAGVKLFYFLVKKFSQEIQVCNPIKHIVSNCMDMLGQEFILKSSENANWTLEEILNNPSSRVLLSTYFSPGVIQNVNHVQQVAKYLQMYQQVVEAVSSSPQDHCDAIFVLLTKFDILLWMNDVNPMLDDRLKLLHHVFKGLVSCRCKMNLIEGSKQRRDGLSCPVKHLSSYISIHGLYASHLQHILSYKFPEALENTIENLLEVSSTEEISSTIWDDILKLPFFDHHYANENTLSMQVDCPTPRIDWNTLVDVVNLITKYFKKYRSKSSRKRFSDIYSRWSSYISPISKLLAFLSKSMFLHDQQGTIPSNYFENIRYFGRHWSVLSEVYFLYNPWIEPIEMDNRELQWPWSTNDSYLAKIITDSLTRLLEDLFTMKKNLSKNLFYILDNFCKIAVSSKYDHPNHIFAAYYKIIWDCPWHAFIPDTDSMETIVKVCDGDNELNKDFICHVISCVSWPFPNNKTPGLSTLEMHNSSEILCRLLHVVFTLGSYEKNILRLKEVIHKLEGFSMEIIGVDQVEYLANIVSDLYSWTSILLSTSVETLKADPRSIIFRLFKIICRIPLIHEETNLTPENVKALPSDTLKQQSYVKCIGRILQKSSIDPHLCTSEIKQRVYGIVISSLESIDMACWEEIPSISFSSVIFNLFDYLNVLPMTFQKLAFEAFIDALSRPYRCEKCCVKRLNRKSDQCQACIYLRSRTICSNTILACMSASCSKMIERSYSVQIIESSIMSYIESISVEKITPNETSHSWYTNCWITITNKLKELNVDEEFTRICIASSSLLTLYAVMLDVEFVPDFLGCLNKRNTNMIETTINNLLELTNKILAWISDVPPLSKNEGKIILLVDYFLYLCSVMWNSAALNELTGVSNDDIAGAIVGLLPILHDFLIDKKTNGMLGSIGISSQSPFTLEFRLIARSQDLFLKQWIAKVYEKSDENTGRADTALREMKNIANSNKQYETYISNIEEVLSIMNDPNLEIITYRKVFLKFVPCYYSHLLYLFHLMDNL